MRRSASAPDVRVANGRRIGVPAYARSLPDAFVIAMKAG
ncbi:hypothetical protein BSIN_4820 [Burkholderia singularis]|uniref:Uncharacterized protein n=1 Tax=Burkholderia singularis TaxID=1503053 RepID=A0A238H9M9_9BURK|nr:hypothetical protein BSIN_4820 [Burkholderia singularis]